MSAERCPECDAPGAGCGCAPVAGFDPLRIRPYVNLSETGRSGDAGPSPQPVLGAMAGPGAPADADADADATELLPTVPPAPPHEHAPAYGAPVPPRQDTPAYGTPVPSPQPWPDHTVPLRAVPRAPGTTNVTAGGEGGGGGPEKRRKFPLLLVSAAALVAVGGVAVALGASGGSGSGGTTLLDAKPSAPVMGLTPGVPSQGSPSASSKPVGFGVRLGFAVAERLAFGVALRITEPVPHLGGAVPHPFPHPEPYLRRPTAAPGRAGSDPALRRLGRGGEEAPAALGRAGPVPRSA